MNNDSGYFKLGLFVIVGIALIVGGVIVFGSGALFTHYITIQTATNSSVEGLGVGAAVKYSGVTLGRVSKIEMASWRYSDPDPAKEANISHYILIEVQIRRDMLRAVDEVSLKKRLDAAIQHGLRLRMASSGLTGPAFLEAVYLDPTSYPIEPVPWTTSEMFVPSAPTTMSEIVTNLQDIIGQIKHSDVDKVVADARTLIKHTDTAITDLQTDKLTEKVQAAIDEVRGTNKRIKQILDNPSIDQTVNDLPKISGQTREALAQVNQILADPKIKKAIDNVNLALAEASTAILQIRRVIRNIDTSMVGETSDIQAIIVNLRRASDNGAAFVEDAKQNPSRVIFGEPPPHYQQPEGAKK